MKWFKHFSDARYDTKMRRLIKKYGLKGYGLYFFIVETIAFNIDTLNPWPDLEDNARDLADFLNDDTIEIEEIMSFCLNEGLFDQDEHTKRIICLKLLTHLDNTMSSNPEIKKLLSNFKKLQETSRSLKHNTIEEKRIEEKTKEKNINNKTSSEQESTSSKFKKPTITQIQAYLDEKKISTIDAEHFYHSNESKGWVVGQNQTPMKSWKSVIQTWVKNRQLNATVKSHTKSFREQDLFLDNLSEEQIALLSHNKLPGGNYDNH